MLSRGRSISRHSRTRSDSSRAIHRRMRDLALTVAKLERKQRDTFDYKNVGISKQAAFLHQLGDWVEDSLKASLEAELGKLPSEFQKVINALKMPEHFCLSKPLRENWRW